MGVSKHNRARNGYFIGSVPPFGYKVLKLKEGQNLEVDENVSPIIKKIFKLSLAGKSQYDVTKYLNEKGYTTAMTYYKTERLYREEGDYEWNVGTVAKLLRNVVYTGTLVQGVKQQNLAKGVKQHFADEEDYIVAPNAHEAIISKEDYEELQRIRKERKANHYFSYPTHDFELMQVIIEILFDAVYLTTVVIISILMILGSKGKRQIRLDGDSTWNRRFIPFDSACSGTVYHRSRKFYRVVGYWKVNNFRYYVHILFATLLCVETAIPY